MKDIINFRFVVVHFVLGCIVVSALTACGGGGNAKSTSVDSNTTNADKTGGDNDTNNTDDTTDANNNNDDDAANNAGEPDVGKDVVVSATSPSDYVWTTLLEGTKVYVDRAFTYNTIPAAYVGAMALQTANNDKVAATNPFVSFEISKPAVIYVAHYAEANFRPLWLSSWNVTGDVVVTSDRSLNVYSRQFSAGLVELGGNEGDGSSSNYVLFINKGATSDMPGKPAPDKSGIASLSWKPPVTNEDSSELTDLAGYIIRYGSAPGSYTNTIVLNNPAASSYEVTGLVSDAYYFVVSAFDYSGNESIYSNEAQKIIP